MNNQTAHAPLAPAAGSGTHVVEEWRCTQCSKSHPCIVLIHYEPGFADRHVGKTRFVRRVCIADETVFPNWVAEPLRVESPNATGSPTGEDNQGGKYGN